MDQWTDWNDFDPRDYDKVKDKAPVEMIPVIWGWDIMQWAAAIDRLGIGGTTQKYMVRLQKEYHEKFRCDPLSAQLIGVQYTADTAIAEEIFRHEELIEYVPIHQMEDI